MKYEGLRCHDRPSAARRRFLGATVALALLLLGGLSTASAQRLQYPEARRVEQVDVHHGVEVHDPYRWLEDADSAETRDFALAQDALTAEVLGADPRFDTYRARFVEIQGGVRQSAMVKRGERIFYNKTPIGGGRTSLAVREGDRERVLIDPERAWPGQQRQVRGFLPDRDGRFAIVALGDGPSTPITYRVLDLERGELLEDRIPDIALISGVTWAERRDGFFYAIYQIPPGGTLRDVSFTDQQVRFHRIGTSADEDMVVFEQPEHPDRSYVLAVGPAGDTLVIVGNERRRQMGHPYVLDLTDPEATVEPLPAPGESVWTYVDNDDRGVVFQTRWEAPRSRLVRLVPGDPDGWSEVTPERDSTLSSVIRAGDLWLATYLVDARRELRVLDRDGAELYAVDLPGIGGVAASAMPDDPIALARTTDVTDPGTIWSLDVRDGTVEPLIRAESLIDPSRYVVEQVFVTSADGTRFPMALARRADLERDGDNPVFMYGYGAWAWPAFPYFQTQWHLWVENGGIFAVPNIRGGGEYGEEWHQAGIKLQKRNAFADMIAAAEWFAESGWSAEGRIIANGGSASGLLAAAVALERPELFGGAVIDHPGLDLVRAQAQPGGGFLVPEYGSVEDEAEFRALLDISPYANVKPGLCYPPMLVTVGEADRSTVPMHGLKFTAAVQHASACDNPMLLEWVPAGGHLVFGTTPEEHADILARQLVFATRAAGARDREEVSSRH